jgi:3-hydroxyacyl-[acyl-carrier-protein] dehydratase|tara:strand:- start:708 stop:1172 length:465 start_codon:yes stop_codon:yes gene_type:complete
MKNLILDKKAILEFQQNRPPYLMIDHATEVVPGVSSRGYKDLKKDEWFFEVHWPNDPNMPGMLQIEALVQMSSLAILTLPNNKGKIMYLASSNNLKFIKKVIPNSRLTIETKIKSFKRGIAMCDGIGMIKNDLVCKAEFTLILPDQLKKYNLNK